MHPRPPACPFWARERGRYLKPQIYVSSSVPEMLKSGSRCEGATRWQFFRWEPILRVSNLMDCTCQWSRIRCGVTRRWYSEECNAHFQQYAVVKQFNPETFQMAQAEEEARETGRLLWGWLRGTTSSAQKLAKRVTDYASESEAETPKTCEAHRVGWTTEHGLERLSEAVCTTRAEECSVLLAEDVPKGCSQVCLCPVHQARYMSTRLPSKCVVYGCNRLGFLSSAGMHLCSEHKETPNTPQPKERRSRSRSRSRARAIEIDEDAENDDNCWWTCG